MRGKRTGVRNHLRQPLPRPEQVPLMGTPDWIVINGGYGFGCLIWPTLAILALRGGRSTLGKLVNWLGRRWRHTRS